MITNYIQKSNKLAKKVVIVPLLLVVLAGLIYPSIDALAVDPLVISTIVITPTDDNAIITWHTNRPAQAKVQYGLYTNRYDYTVNSNESKTDQAITIFGLYPETTYYVLITATDNYSQVISYEQSFKTLKRAAKESPTISKVTVVYTTGKTATIQWQTDQPATTEVEFAINPIANQYTNSAGDGSLVTVHDITLTNLLEGTLYHFRVKSKNQDNNASLYSDLTFRTDPTNKADKDDLIIYDVKPSGENDFNVTRDTAVISWRTNKLSKGWVRYDTNTNYGKTVADNPPRSFQHSVTLTGLKPGTTYYYVISVQDVFGKQIESNGLSFTTKSIAAAANNNLPTYTGQILGSASCDVNLKTDLGYTGLYFYLGPNDPDVELPPGQAWPKIAAQNHWFNSQYYAGSQVDTRLNFGDNFKPNIIVQADKNADYYYFAVQWRAIIDVPKDDFYTYSISSDDDAWLYIDDELITNLGGIHGSQTENKSVSLTAGYHKLEIYHAERHKVQSSFSFVPDSRLTFHPLPDGCEIQDVLDYNNDPTPQSIVTGKVLGVSTINDAVVKNPYACNPDLGYTKIKALYKTSASPDIWAILVSGQKHYITSPQAFNEYQCDWNAVKVVSQKALDKYPTARLVKGLNSASVYYLYERPEKKWLKLNLPSPTVFISYPGNHWGNIITVSNFDVAAYPDARLLKTQNSADIYLLNGGQKQLIPSMTVFYQHHFIPAEIVQVNQIHLDSYTPGTPLQ